MINKLRNFVDDKSFRINIFDKKINIINYNNILSLEEDRISVQTDKKVIIIKGNNLSIEKLMNNEILVVGDFNLIEFR